MSTLHIALVRQKYNAAGGAERFVSRAIQALANDGAQITLLTRKWENLQGMQAIRLNPFYLGNVWRDAGFARAVCRVQQSQSFDLVQSHERLACCDVYRAGDGVHREWLAQRRRVLSPLGKLSLLLNPYHHYVQAAEARMFQSPRLKTVICNSKMVKAEIQHYFGLPDERFEIIYNGIDTDLFRPGNRERQPGEPFRLLYVGSWMSRKGVDLLAPIMRELGDGFELHYTGGSAAEKDKAGMPTNMHASVMAYINNGRFPGIRLAPAESTIGITTALVVPWWVP